MPWWGTLLCIVGGGLILSFVTFTLLSIHKLGLEVRMNRDAVSALKEAQHTLEETTRAIAASLASIRESVANIDGKIEAWESQIGGRG